MENQEEKNKPLTREEFLKKLVLLYPTSFNENNLQIWMSAYKEVLTDRMNYDKLFKSMIADNQYNSAPKPAWLKERATYIKTEEEEQTFEKLVYEVNSTEYEFYYNANKEGKYLARESLEKRFKNNGHEFEFIEPAVTTNVF